MTNKKMVALSIAMSIAAAAPLASFAADPSAGTTATPAAPAGGVMHHGGHGRGAQYEDIRTVLKPDQTEKFEAIVRESREKTKPIYEKMAALKQTAQDDPKLQELKQQLTASRKATAEKLMGLLSPEQVAKVKEIKKQRKAAGGGEAEAEKGDGK